MNARAAVALWRRTERLDKTVKTDMKQRNAGLPLRPRVASVVAKSARRHLAG